MTELGNNNNLLDLLSRLFNDDENKLKDFKRLDLTKDEDYNTFNNLLDNFVDECPKGGFFGGIMKMMYDYVQEFVNYIKEIAKAIHEADKKYKENNEKENNNDTEAHEESGCDCCSGTHHMYENVNCPELPSSKLSIERKQNIHKIVTEYVDTMIRPYTDMDTETINDAYAGLFEFACWVLNK